MHKLEPLTEFERKFATENHNLVYEFLKRNRYSLENYYDIAIFGFLKAVQIYNRREDLQNEYDFRIISSQYMRSELGNYRKLEDAKKRKPLGMVVSLDAKYAESDNLYNCITNEKSPDPELEVVTMEQVTELLDDLSDTQRKIVEMKINGYSSKEIYSALKMKSSTYYSEVQKIKTILSS